MYTVQTLEGYWTAAITRVVTVPPVYFVIDPTLGKRVPFRQLEQNFPADHAYNLFRKQVIRVLDLFRKIAADTRLIALTAAMHCQKHAVSPNHRVCSETLYHAVALRKELEDLLAFFEVVYLDVVRFNWSGGAAIASLQYHRFESNRYRLGQVETLAESKAQRVDHLCHTARFVGM